MTRFKREDEFTVFSGVTFGIKSKSGKAILCKFKDGTERWVPVSQMEDDGGDLPEGGTTGDLSVTQWIVDQWADESAPANPRNALVSVSDVVALRETQRGLQVRAGSGEAVWLARSQVHATSDVKFDGDRGTLVVPKWVADEKGLGGAPASRSVGEDVDASKAVFDAEDDIPF